MSGATRLHVATASQSIWFSRDKGENWDRPYAESGLEGECRAWTLSAHPDHPDEVYAGTDRGLFLWRESKKTWTHLPSALDSMTIYTLRQSPHDANLMLAGTQKPCDLWRSTDRGVTWTRLYTGIAQNCIYVRHPRVTQIAFDPADKRTIYAGVEIDGVWRSTDGGDSWRKVGKGLLSEDIHGILPTGIDGGTVFATTNMGLHRSTDKGESWTPVKLDSPSPYTRTVFAPPGAPADDLFVTNGDGPPGSWGRLHRSRDGGKTFTEIQIPQPTNSTVWTMAGNAADPKLLFAATNLGQLFRSTDGGSSWTKLKRELSDIRAVM